MSEMPRWERVAWEATGIAIKIAAALAILYILALWGGA